jgi:CDP-diacylglycerol---glycerol-3-phosphate 3-phosphatidyltransferase
MNARTSTRYLVPSASDYASLRLKGTVWARLTSARLLYRGLMAVGGALGRVGISANALTYASLALAVGAAVAVALGAFPLAAALVVASGACDVLDGVIARATGTVTRYGALLDSTVDRLADAMPLLGLSVFYSGHGLSLSVSVPVLAILGAFTVSYVRARAEGLRVQLPPLFMRRAERMVLLTLSLALGAVDFGPTTVNAPLTLLGVGLLALLNFAGSIWALRAAHTALTAVNAAGSASERPLPQ